MTGHKQTRATQMQTFGFPNQAFAFDVAVLLVSRGERCKLFKESGIWYVAI